MAKTALVTGGAGFLGSWMCERLISEGFGVICLDNVGSGSWRNVDHLIGKKNFKFIKQDVTKPIKIGGNVDYVFSMASRASPVDFDEHAVDILMTNSLGTKNALDLARKKKARFLLASSSEVYGDPLEHPQKETYRGNVSTTGPRSPYDESKRFAEALAFAYLRNYKVDVRVARIFNTYGPRMRKDDGRIVPNFIMQTLKGRPITVYGNGSQTRSFCFVDDLVEGLVRLMLKDGLSGQVTNIGNPREFTVLEVAKLVKKLTDSRSKIIFKPLPKDDPARRKPDIAKAKKLLGWEPKVPFEKGLLETVDYFRGLG